MNPPKFNETAPGWFLTIRPGEQQRLDNLYGYDLLNWRAAAAGWIEDQQRKRDASADPEKYIAQPFVRPIPQREVYDWGDDGPYSWFEPVDPNIHAPVLPPYAKPTAPNAGIKALPDPKDEALFSLLITINKKLDALLAKG